MDWKIDIISIGNILSSNDVGWLFGNIRVKTIEISLVKPSKKL